MEKGKYRRKFSKIYLWVLALILVGASVWGVSAKYIQQREQDLLAEARMFYFTSDLLKEEGADYVLNPDTTSVTFTLRNHIDELRYSDDEIQYDVYVDDVQLGSTAALNMENQTDEITFSVQPGRTYRVRAVGNAGYQKVLTATFEVLPYETGFYKHLVDQPSSNYVLLTVWTQNLSGNVTVNFPAGLIPDATDPDLDEVHNYTSGHYTQGSVTVSFDVYSSKTYRFFKENPGNSYSVGDFTVSMGNTAAVPGTP